MPPAPCSLHPHPQDESGVRRKELLVPRCAVAAPEKAVLPNLAHSDPDQMFVPVAGTGSDVASLPPSQLSSLLPWKEASRASLHTATWPLGVHPRRGQRSGLQRPPGHGPHTHGPHARHASPGGEVPGWACIWEKSRTPSGVLGRVHLQGAACPRVSPWSEGQGQPVRSGDGPPLGKMRRQGTGDPGSPGEGPARCPRAQLRPAGRGLLQAGGRPCPDRHLREPPASHSHGWESTQTPHEGPAFRATPVFVMHGDAEGRVPHPQRAPRPPPSPRASPSPGRTRTHQHQLRGTTSR